MMTDQEKEKSKKKRAPLHYSFGYAFRGIGYCIAHERNMKIHCFAAAMVVLFGILLKISTHEWQVCLILFALVMGLEMVNTAVESVVDLVTEERKPLARIAKDAAAGAVLIVAIASAIIGLNIFVPRIVALLS